MSSFQTDAEELEDEESTIKGRLRWLDCLEAAGVDNWQGIEYAIELFKEGSENNAN